MHGAHWYEASSLQQLLDLQPDKHILQCSALRPPSLATNLSERQSANVLQRKPEMVHLVLIVCLQVRSRETAFLVFNGA